ncbi:MAG TPA: hypothetical protein VMS76_03590 [Planctomycetota bacterium]|nr:hypothetical protein [Planctomycetota bacterium]
MSRATHRQRALLLAALALAACGASDPVEMNDQGAAALNRGDPKAALELFGGAAAALDPESEQGKRAILGQVEALVALDPPRARDTFLAYARAQPAQLEPRDYRRVASQLTGGRHFLEAIDVIQAGDLAHPGDEMIRKMITVIGEEAKMADAPDALNKLKGLGYL